MFTIDVSSYDWDRKGGPLDWATIKQTCPIMCARASYGRPGGPFFKEDDRFIEHVTGAQNADMLMTGGYHNLVRDRSQAGINIQVDWFRRALDGAQADWAMLDVEAYGDLVTKNLVPRMIDVLRFAWRWEQVEPGRALTYYISRNMWTNTIGKPNLTTLPTPFVVSADYPMKASPGTPTDLFDLIQKNAALKDRGLKEYGGVNPLLWQFSSNAIIPGASNQSDINYTPLSPEMFFMWVMK